MEYAPGRVANLLGHIPRWSQSCSKRLATASFTVMDEVHLNMMLQRFVRYAYASAYAAKVFYDTENVQPRGSVGLDSLPDRNHAALLTHPRSFFSIISSCFGIGISRREVRVLGVWMTTFVCPFPQEIRQTVRLIFSVPSFRSKSPHCKPQISPIRRPNSNPNNKPILRGVGFSCTYW